jgi:hypothetical protein
LRLYFGGIERREGTALKLAGYERRRPAQLFPLQSIVCAGLSASPGSTVLLAAGVQASAAGGEFATVEGEAGEPGFLARGVERGAGSGMASGPSRVLEADEKEGEGTVTKRDETPRSR